MLAGAWLTLHLWELWPDAQDWVHAEGELRTLRERYRRSHGEDNPLTLAASVDLAYALVSQGKRDKGGEELSLLLPRLHRQLGARHPLSLRAVFLRGLIHAQRQQYTLAAPLFERALRGQLAPVRAEVLLTKLHESCLLTRQPGGLFVLHDFVRAQVSADELPRLAPEARDSALERLVLHLAARVAAADAAIEPHRYRSPMRLAPVAGFADLTAAMR